MATLSASAMKSQEDDAEDGFSEADLDSWRASQEILEVLPPMPAPDSGTQRFQSALGLIGVISAVLAAVIGTRVCTRIMDSKWGPLPHVLFVLVHIEAVVALVCLAGIMLADPGVVQRSPETCLPVPRKVALKLRRSETLNSRENVTEEEGRVYCTRCFVWRENRVCSSNGGFSGMLEKVCEGRNEGSFHHCSICQRCVKTFDHHCGFFGRCIAGSGLQGNMIYFKIIISVGLLGYATAALAMVLGIHRYRFGHWVAIGVAVYCSASFLIWFAMFLFGGARCLIQKFFPSAVQFPPSKWVPIPQFDSPRATTVGAA